MMNSADIRRFRSSIVILLNNTDLPNEVKRLVVKDVLAEIETVTEQEINNILSQELLGEESEETEEHGIQQNV